MCLGGAFGNSTCPAEPGNLFTQPPSKGLRRDATTVTIKATHHCMTTRGLHKPGTDLVTSRMLGCFRDNFLTRQEFLGMAT